MFVRFLKDWTLPIAMLAGTIGYFIFADIPFWHQPNRVLMV